MSSEVEVMDDEQSGLALKTNPVTTSPEKAIPDFDSTASSPDVPAQLHAKTWLPVLAVGMIYFAQLVNLVGVGAQGQVIAGHFNDATDTVYFSSPITILTVVLGPVVSQAADYWGRKWVLVVLTLFGAIGSLIVALASSMSQAIAGFTIIGIAYGTQPLLHVVASEVLPRRWRGYAQAADLISNALGSIVGLLVGAVLNRTNDPTSNGFRYYYYMTIALFFSAAILCAIVYNPPETEKQREFTNAQKLAKLDWVGYFLLAAGLLVFCLGLSYFENPYDFRDAHVATTFAIGLALGLGLMVYETWFKTDGMFHHGTFTGNRNFAIATCCVFGEGVAFFAANTYFAFQVSVLYETDSVLVATRYCIMLIAASISSLFVGWYCDKTQQVWGYPVLLGVAFGMTLTTLVTVAQLSTPPDLIAIATGLIISVRSLGGTIGIAIYNALFSDEMSHLPQNIANAVIPDGLSPDNPGQFIVALTSHNQTAVAIVPGVTPQIIGNGLDALLDTYILAFPHEFNMHIDAPMEKDEIDISTA
ncbi:MFS general substrate transporter [Thozetella sp. PMI_491]|nr:MFS general substrate transporter [Thozetella sp. PMI_491]